MKNFKIGFFDSGVGGLSVLKEALRILSNENMVYLGDTNRVPYGVRSSKEVEKFTLECIEFLKGKNLDACVISCNTATAYGLEKSKKFFEFPIIGVVEPACEYALSSTRNGKIALIATNGTVKSGIYENTIYDLNPNIEVRSIGCPDLVMAIENGHISDDYVYNLIKNYLKDFGGYDYDTLILGCTHFPLVKQVFKNFFSEDSKNINIVDPAINTVDKLKNILEDKNSNEIGSPKKQFIDFYVTGDVNKFKNTALKIIDTDNKKVTFNKVRL
ncbi:MAG: glutamate racemase [Peptoniphilaceae bacterium]